ncbi:hypothetical protein G9A89_018517 [Geosiphon pyriformis]|nr:hypothetical protein G9A89_018517 [Geosiphon pyriformis]
MSLFQTLEGLAGAAIKAKLGGGGQQEDSGSEEEASPTRPPAKQGNRPSNLDVSDAHKIAAEDSGHDPEIFENALSKAKSKVSRRDEEDDEEEEDEEKYAQLHKKVYKQKANAEDGSDEEETPSSSGLGSAAAMQAFKMLKGGKGDGEGGSGLQSQLVGVAMSEAAKLWEARGGKGGGSKEDAVTQAATMAMKMLIAKKGGEGGGLSSLASQFLSKRE